MKRNPTPCFALLAKRSLFLVLSFASLRTICFAVLCSLFFTACGMFPGQEKNYTASDLNGTWTEDANPQCFWVYSLTKDDSGEYYWGKTWDEAEDVYESDLEYHGNGWFKWSITNNNLVQIHMLNLKEKKVPKTYTVTSCTSTTLELKDTYGKTLTYKKVK